MMRSGLLGTGLVLVAILFLLDPYTVGKAGGDEEAFTRFYWQPGIAAASLVLLWVAFERLRRGTNLLVPLLMELVLFALANAIYILRDGWDVRMFNGYQGSPVPLIAISAGFLVRGGLLVTAKDSRILQG
jgi:hypothetical protein